jgi:dUTPase
MIFFRNLNQKNGVIEKLTRICQINFVTFKMRKKLFLYEDFIGEYQRTGSGC